MDWSNLEELKLLGSGHEASVYLVEDRVSKQQYALKVYAQDAVHPGLILYSLSVYCYVSAHIGCVPKMLDSRRNAAGELEVLMEYFPGSESISSMGGLYDFGQAAGILVQILDCLEKLADIGVHHGDVFSGNILLTPEGTVYLIDFGYACLDKVLSAEYIQREIPQCASFSGAPFVTDECLEDRASYERVTLPRLVLVYLKLIDDVDPPSARRYIEQSLHVPAIRDVLLGVLDRKINSFAELKVLMLDIEKEFSDRFFI